EEQENGDQTLAELYHRAVVDDDLYAQYDLARLLEEEEQARIEEEALHAHRAEEDARLEREQWHYFDVVVMRRHLPSFTYLRPVGRERRVACNHRRRGSRRSGSSSRSSSSDDPDPEPDDIAARRRPIREEGGR